VQETARAGIEVEAEPSPEVDDRQPHEQTCASPHATRRNPLITVLLVAAIRSTVHVTVIVRRLR
jgi:hypothetical protein